MNDVFICDDFLDKNELMYSLDILNKTPLFFGHVSDSKKSSPNPFWHIVMEHNYFFMVNLKTKILSKLKEITNENYDLLKCYLNAHTYGQDGDFHIDDAEENESYTFVLYLPTLDISNLNQLNIDDTSGYLLIKHPLDNGAFVRSYEPLNNRGIFFPSHYSHKALAFNRYTPLLRRCITWKLVKESWKYILKNK